MLTKQRFCDPAPVLASLVDDSGARFQVGQQLASLKLPTAFIMEGGYATEALGTNVVNVLEGFEQA